MSEQSELTRSGPFANINGDEGFMVLEWNPISRTWNEQTADWYAALIDALGHVEANALRGILSYIPIRFKEIE